jgi:integrase
MKASYTDPIVCPRDRDMKKEWFVYFRWTDPVTKERIPIKKRADLNSFKDKKERIRCASALVANLKEKLEQGWNPLTETIQDTPAQNEPQVQKNLSKWLDSILPTKKSLKRKSYKDYENMIKIFKIWLNEAGLENISVENFTSKLAIQFLDYCVIGRENSGRTRNNKMTAMRTLFYDIFKRDKELFANLQNPFAHITHLPERKGNNYALTREERAKLKEYLYPEHKEFYFACCFMFFCCLRRPDVANIRFKDIDRRNMVLLTHSNSTKSLRQEAVRMPAAMNEILDEMEIEKYPETWYVFSKKFKPGPESQTRLGAFTEFFRTVADELGIDPVKSFYSYKHSGACEYFMLTQDLMAVMRHLRHTDPIVTMNYLRSLGQMVDDKIKHAPINM